MTTLRYLRDLDYRTPSEQRRDHDRSLDRLRRRCGATVLAELRDAGYRLWIEGGTLRIGGARMTDAAAARLEEFREFLVGVLNEEAGVKP